MTEKIHFTVSGRVQGVGFRYFTRRTAIDLGIFGWVRNLPDGRVEAEAHGPTGALEKLLMACRRGPDQSAVEQVKIESRSRIDAMVFNSFEIR